MGTPPEQDLRIADRIGFFLEFSVVAPQEGGNLWPFKTHEFKWMCMSRPWARDVHLIDLFTGLPAQAYTSLC